jgi:hypothetical protein
MGCSSNRPESTLSDSIGMNSYTADQLPRDLAFHEEFSLLAIHQWASPMSNPYSFPIDVP